jgi:hypothetical protein
MEKSTTPANYFYSLSHKTTTFCILFLCFVLAQGWAQTFEQVFLPGYQGITEFDGVFLSSIAFADVDGDNDQDVLITGLSNSGPIAKLYTNDGNGGYSLVSGTPFDGVYYSSIAFADVDGDNDQDVLITGYNNLNQIAKLYTNDGNGGFTLDIGTPFEGVSASSIAFADVDGDNDQDVLITGYNNLNQRIAKLYTNDGSGGYTLVSGTPFEGVSAGSITFADVDGDNDQDVLITGASDSVPISKLYTNDGNGGYSLVSGTPFDGVSYSSIAFADVDGDNDQDVLITGFNNFEGIAKLYTNDGNGGYTLVSGTPFDGVSLGSIAFADVDGDNDLDVLITGYDNYGRMAKLYTNEGNGGFSLVSGTPFDGVESSSIAFADVDGDNDQDVLITGYNNFGAIAKLYTNDGNGGYTLVSGTPFEGVSSGSIAFADVDGDNDQDVLITGSTNSGAIAKLYTNDGNGGFSLVSGTPFDGVKFSSIAFADVDGDNDQDVLITGQNDLSQIIAKLFTNDGNGDFLLVSGTPFDGVANSSIAFADVDGDNDQDVLITGFTNSGQRISKLYTNDGNGGYSQVSGTPFDGVANSSIAFADIDGDNDQDVLITGQNDLSQIIADLYTNDGNGGYSLVSGTPFDGVYQSSIAFADVDGDNDKDVLITGSNNSSQRIAKLYNNDGNGVYSLVAGTPFDGVFLSSIAFADVDGDNDKDVLITGLSNSERIAKLYTNDGNGGYSLVSGTPFDGVYVSSIVFADVDGDNDQDVLITGYSNFGGIAKLYRNTTHTGADTGPSSSICSGNSATIGATAITGNTYSWVSSPIGFTSTDANPTVSPTVTTTYTLTQTITATGIAKTGAVTITVNPLPAADAGSTSSICSGNSATIGATAVTGNTYSWVSSPIGFTSTEANPTVSPTITTTYTLTETITATGCTKSGTVTITVNPNVTYYADTDGDTFGDNANSLITCTGIPAGYVTNNTDCAPADATKWRSASLYIDVDGDNYDNGSTTICYGAAIPAGYKATTLGSDCNDNNANIHPGAVETCDGLDNNCNGNIDEGCPVLRSLSIGNVSKAEGNKGQSKMVFTVALNQASTQKITVRYSTNNGTAIAGSDYVANSGSLTFKAGITTQSISVAIKGDKVNEPDETFTVNLSTPTNAQISTAVGTGTILNDDAPIVASVVSTETTAFKAIAYPNPFAEYFKLHIVSAGQERVEVRVYDLTGKLIDVRNFDISEVDVQEIGTGYPAGVYNIIVAQGVEVKTIRIIKQ